MSNNLTAIIKNVAGTTLEVVRNNCVAMQLAQTDFGPEYKSKGETVDFPGQSLFTAIDVEAGEPTPQDIVIPSRSMVLNFYKEVTVQLTAKEIAILGDSKGLVETNVLTGMGMAISDALNLFFLQKAYQSFFRSHGTIGVVPSAITDLTALKRIARQEKWPSEDRFLLHSSAMEAKMLELAILTERSATGDDSLIEGEFGNKRMGFRHIADTQVDDLEHTVGAADGAYVVNDDTDHVIGDKSLRVETGAGAVAAGQQFLIAGDTLPYVCADGYAGGAGAMTIEPGLRLHPANHAAITFTASQPNMSLAFSKYAMGIAVRPLAPLGHPTEANVVDAGSNLALHMFVRPMHSKVYMTARVLAAVGARMPEWGVRIFDGA